MQYLSLKELQQVNLELLLEFKEICEEHSLRYDLCGGTLLGAIRHKGFIPWDDDADVSMPRPDYERLLKLSAQGELRLSDGHGLISNRDESFARHYARYIRKDVLRDAEYAAEDDCPYIGLDIFPHDGVYANEVAFALQVKRISFMRRLLLLSTAKPGVSKKSGFYAIAKELARRISSRIGAFNIADKLDSICSEVPFESARYVGGITGMYGKRERWAKEDMLPQVQVEFCGYPFLTYANYNIYLGNIYGDYMKLPPKDKQVPHGDKAYWAEEEGLDV